jgi:thiosulfate/3-mercaptopyruvate sulfurtransferase
MSSIISVKDFKNLTSNNLVILDARVGNDAYNIYLENHVKGARFINLDSDLAGKVDDAAFGGRHPLPDLEKFCKTIASLGISKDSNIVIYDDKSGSNAASRAWWMLKSVGILNVWILSGGIQALEKEGIEFCSGEENFESFNHFEASNWLMPQSSLEEVETEILNNTATVIDVRDSYRYNGVSEPIDLVAGHIPGAINIPFSENLDENGAFLSPEILKEKYLNLLQGRPKKLILHCGSGVTACHTIVALYHAGFDIPNLYVGSWSEWSRREGKEIAKEI